MGICSSRWKNCSLRAYRLSGMPSTSVITAGTSLVFGLNKYGGSRAGNWATPAGEFCSIEAIFEILDLKFGLFQKCLPCFSFYAAQCPTPSWDCSAWSACTPWHCGSPEALAQFALPALCWHRFGAIAGCFSGDSRPSFQPHPQNAKCCANLCPPLGSIQPPWKNQN